MFLLSNKLYNKLRQDEVLRARTMLMKISINTIFDNITRSCWRNGLQYATLVKSTEVLVIKLYSHKESVLLKFHKTDIVFFEDYKRFSAMLEANGAVRGVYITTGVFEERVINGQRGVFPFIKDIKIEDGFAFIRKQLGICGKAGTAFNNRNLNFFSYLPN